MDELHESQIRFGTRNKNPYVVLRCLGVIGPRTTIDDGTRKYAINAASRTLGKPYAFHSIGKRRIPAARRSGNEIAQRYSFNKAAGVFNGHTFFGNLHKRHAELCIITMTKSVDKSFAKSGGRKFGDGCAKQPLLDISFRIPRLEIFRIFLKDGKQRQACLLIQANGRTLKNLKCGLCRRDETRKAFFLAEEKQSGNGRQHSPLMLNGQTQGFQEFLIRQL